MSLKVQLISLGFSFVFGIIFMLLVKFNHKILFTGKKIMKVICSFLFILDMSFIYFLILRKINQGILHIYFLFLFLFGCYIGYLILQKCVKKT